MTVSPRFKKLYFLIFLPSLFILLDMAVGVWYTRYRDFNSFRTKDLYFHHGLLPNQKAVHLWGDRTYLFETNSLGFKDKERRVIKPNADHKRVVFIGDSFTEAVGFPFSESFVGILEKQLSEKNIEVLNTSVESYSPKLYYLKMRYLIEKVGLDLDHLVVMLDLSDIQDEITYEDYPSMLDSSASPLAQQFRVFLNQVSNVLKNYSMIYKTVYKRMTKSYRKDIYIAKSYTWENIGSYQQERNMWTDNPYVYRGWGEKGIELAKANMQKLVELCRQHDIDISIVIYPWPKQIKDQNLDSKQVTVWREFAKDNDVPLINLFPTFLNAGPYETVIETYFVKGDFHWNQEGHKKIAAELVSML